MTVTKSNGWTLLLLTCLAGTLQGGDWDRMKAIVPQGYVCHRAPGPMAIDGRLDEAAWQSAAWTADFQDIEGATRPKPTWRTRAKMLWDDSCLYVAAELEEPHVWGVLTQRDSVIFQDPDFEVFIDPDGDTHSYHEFEMNARNTVWDLFLDKPYKDGGKAENAWDIAGLRTAVQVRGTLNNPADRDEGWTLEIAFPWKALKEHAHRSVPPREGDQWRLGFSRVEWDIETKEGRYVKVPNRPEHNWVWSPQGIIDMHRPERWGYVQFTKRAPGTVRFQRDPAEPAREALMEVYHAQRDFQKLHQRWATSLAELGLKAGLSAGGSPSIRLTQAGYEAEVRVRGSGRGEQVWCVREDSRLWRK